MWTWVRRLVDSQFPQWADLPIRPVVPMGWDNRIFRLGDDMVVRLPSARAYAPQVEKEHRWLPILGPQLPLPIPTPIAMGRPCHGYPWPWSIYGWLPGRTLSMRQVSGSHRLARSLRLFLGALQRVDPTGGPPPGPDNFHRGGSLRLYDAETRQAISLLEAKSMRWRRCGFGTRRWRLRMRAPPCGCTATSASATCSSKAGHWPG